MNTRIAGFLYASLSFVGLLAGCGGGGGEDEAAAASIVSVVPGEVDIATDQELESVQVFVRTSTDPSDTGRSVCATSTGADFPVVRVAMQLPDVIPGPMDPTAWEVTFEPDPELSVGEHTGVLEVFLSSDPACEVRASPSHQVPYRITKVYGFAQPQPVTLHVQAETTADDLHGSARIDMAAGPEHGWTARSISSWLVVDTTSGLTGTDVQFHIDPARVASLFRSGRSESGGIEIAGDTEGMTPGRLGVSLQLVLPMARTAMPPDQPAGSTRQFRVRGEGFTEEAIADTHLAVEGVPDAVFTRLSDRDLVVQLPASLPAGTYRVAPPNALGVSPPSALLRLTGPVETARAVLPGNGSDGHMLWDGARSALLVLEPPVRADLEYSNTLRRHALRGGVWTTTERGADMLRRMGISHDGARLVGLSGSSWESEARLYLLDPVRLDSAGIYGFSTVLHEPPSQAPLAMTIDGHAWSGSRNALLAFDLVNPGPMKMMAPLAWTSASMQSARTIASRDGGRLLVSRPETGAFLYRDATEPLVNVAFHANPAGATTFEAISDDGGRVLSGVNVYDSDFALLGTLPGPAILSGDGRRAFTLESRGDWLVGGPAPVVHVFDLTAPTDGGGALPELGTVDLLDHATCAARERTCAPTSSLAVTPDGRVLFAQTAGGVVVVPIPESLVAP